MSPLAIWTALRSVPRWAWCGIAVVALVIAAAVYVGHRERAAVQADRAEHKAEVTETVLDAERTANRNDEERRTVRRHQTRELETARDEAINANPDESNLPAGPSVTAVLSSLREQERRTGGSTP